MGKNTKMVNTLRHIYRVSYRTFLAYYFENCVGSARFRLNTGEFNTDFELLKTKLIVNLEKIVKVDLPENYGVTKQDLIEILDLARKSDFSKSEDINGLYNLYNRIKDKKLSNNL